MKVSTEVTCTKGDAKEADMQGFMFSPIFRFEGDTGAIVARTSLSTEMATEMATDLATDEVSKQTAPVINRTEARHFGDRFGLSDPYLGFDAPITTELFYVGTNVAIRAKELTETSEIEVTLVYKAVTSETASEETDVMNNQSP